MTGEELVHTFLTPKGGNGAAEKVKQPAVRWYQLSRAPQVLTLHLKVARPSPPPPLPQPPLPQLSRTRPLASQRFTNKLDKIDKHINFPARLDVTPLLCDGVAPPPTDVEELASRGASPPRGASYELYAVVEHLGNYRQGHYRSYAKLADPGASAAPGEAAATSWRFFDDSRTHGLKEEARACTHTPIHPRIQQLLNSGRCERLSCLCLQEVLKVEPFMLFYRKIEAADC